MQDGSHKIRKHLVQFSNKWYECKEAQDYMAAKGYDLDLTGKVCSEGLNFFIPSWLCMC